MSPIRLRFPAAVLVSLAVATPGPLHAQPCQPSWSDRFPGGDLNYWPLTLVTLDVDGQGPEPTALFAGGYFTGAGGLAANGIARWDGTRWTPLAAGVTGTSNPGVWAIALFDEDAAGPNPPALFAGGQFTHAGGVLVNHIARWDGAAWSAVGGGIGGGQTTRVRALAVHDEDGPGPGSAALFVGGEFTTAGGVATRNVARWDGNQWSAVGGGLGGTVAGTGVYALSVFDVDGSGPGGKSLFAGGNLPEISHAARWDGTTWSRVGGFDRPVNALATYEDPDGAASALYAGGYFRWSGATRVEHVARLDGFQWRPLGEGVGDVVNSLVVRDEETADGSVAAVYAAGPFYSAGGAPARGIARWDGAEWSAMGDGLLDCYGGAGGCVTTPYSMTFFDDDGQGPTQTSLYVGGNFTAAGDEHTGSIARWDGASWHPLGRGVTGGMRGHAAFVRTATVSDNPGSAGPRLFAGGHFTRADGERVAHVAAYDGQAWTALGDGVSGRLAQVRTILPLDHDGDESTPPWIVAGGHFEEAGGVPASNVAAWDGASWCPLGSGFDLGVFALAVFDDDDTGPRQPFLYAGGNFATSGTVAVNGIARWDGTDWQPVGSGVSQYGVILAIAAFDEDGSGPLPEKLIAGGVFQTAGSEPVGNIAAWNGTSWSALAAGIGGQLSALAVFDEDGTGGRPPALFASGYFPGGILRWDGQAWSDVGGSLPGFGYILALAVFDDDGPGPRRPVLFAGGRFTIGSALNIARWDGVSWTRLDAGVGAATSEVLALAGFDVDRSGPESPILFVGGRFRSAGGFSSQNIAAWEACATPTGDMNCDGVLDLDDIGPFALALTDPVAYALQFPACEIALADMNGDRRLDGADVPLFVDAVLQRG